MSTSQAPKWFKVVVVLALLWNLMGILNFIMQINLSDEAIAAFPSAERTTHEQHPPMVYYRFWYRRIWRYIGLSGTFNAQRWSFFPLLFSLIAVMAQMTYWIYFTEAVAVYGNEAYGMPLVVKL